ncbi:MAG: RNA polymerase sigma factor, partial [Acidimicrobiia bacterium]
MDNESARRKFEAIYDQHRRAILAYSRRRADEQNAHEIMNETFAIVWRHIGKAPEPDSALPWLYSTARGVLSNRRRSDQRYARLIARAGSMRPVLEIGPEAQVVRNQELQRIATALSRLSPSDREILLLAVWEELPRAVIGEVLG